MPFNIHNLGQNILQHIVNIHNLEQNASNKHSIFFVVGDEIIL